jgi:hypothetical protein
VKRTGIARTTPLARGDSKLGARKGKRRSRHPMALPPVDGSPAVLLLDEHQGDPVAFGRQAELCRGTVCCACFARWWRTAYGRQAIDWTQLPTIVDETRSEAHHEPPIGLRRESDDDDTIPLCLMHHGRKGDPARSFAVRHGAVYEHNPAAFYVAANIIDYTGPRDEMRRRTAEQARTP